MTRTIRTEHGAPRPDTKPTRRPYAIVGRMQRAQTGPTGAAMENPMMRPRRKNEGSIAVRYPRRLLLGDGLDGEVDLDPVVDDAHGGRRDRDDRRGRPHLPGEEGGAAPRSRALRAFALRLAPARR